MEIRLKFNVTHPYNLSLDKKYTIFPPQGTCTGEEKGFSLDMFDFGVCYLYSKG